MKYKRKEQTDRNGEKAHILIREDGSETSPLTSSEAYAILYAEEILCQFTELAMIIENMDENSVIFGNELKSLIADTMVSSDQDSESQKLLKEIKNGKKNSQKTS